MTIEEALSLFRELADQYDRTHPRAPMVDFVKWLGEQDLTPEQDAAGEVIAAWLRRRQFRVVDDEGSPADA